MLTPTEIENGLEIENIEIYCIANDPTVQSILNKIARAVRHPVEVEDDSQHLTDGEIIDYLDSYLQQLGV